MQFIVTTHFHSDTEAVAYRVSAPDATTAENLVWEYFEGEDSVAEQESRPASIPLSLADSDIPKLPGN